MVWNCCKWNCSVLILWVLSFTCNTYEFILFYLATLVALTTDDDDEAVDDVTEGIVVDVAPPVPIDADVDDEGVGCALGWDMKQKMKKTTQKNIPL